MFSRYNWGARVADGRLQIGVSSQPSFATAARAAPCVARGSGQLGASTRPGVERVDKHLHHGSRGCVVLRRSLQRRAAHPNRAPFIVHLNGQFSARARLLEISRNKMAGVVLRVVAPSPTRTRYCQDPPHAPPVPCLRLRSSPLRSPPDRPWRLSVAAAATPAHGHRSARTHHVHTAHN
jgi:hypothetical protein